MNKKQKEIMYTLGNPLTLHVKWGNMGCELPDLVNIIRDLL